MSEGSNSNLLSLPFPKEFDTFSFIENTTDISLLKMALTSEKISKNKLLFNLITGKILYLSSNFSLNSSQILLAKTEKETGNELMKSQNYQSAITHYSYSIISNPKESTTYCNRALAYYKIKEYVKSILDCTQAIYLKNDYIKAFYRRSLSLCSLSHFSEAFEDALYLLTNGDGTAEVEAAVSSVMAEWKSAVGEENFMKIEKDLKEKVERAKKKELILGSPMEISEEKTELFNKWNNSSLNVKSQIMSFLDKKEHSKAADVCKICLEQCKEFLKKFSMRTIHYIKILEKINELDILKKCLDSQVVIDISNQKKKENKKKYDTAYKTSLLTKEQREEATRIAEKSINFTDFGKTAYGFERAYNSFKGNLENFYRFMKYFEGKTLIKAYASSEISMPIIYDIINIIKKKESQILSNENEAEFAIDYLDGISKSKSFGLVKNFIKKKDKEWIKDILGKIGKNNENLKSKCEEIIKNY